MIPKLQVLTNEWRLARRALRLLHLGEKFCKNKTLQRIVRDFERHF
jgi:hypothetical protein